MKNLQEIKTKLNTKIDNKKVWFIIGVLALVTFIWVLSVGKELKSPTTVEEVITTPVAEVQKTLKTTKNQVVSVNPTYMETLAKYGDKRIQFNKDCQAFPNNVTYKNNTSIMLDNRSNIDRNLNIDGPITIKAYDFKIITLSSPSLPKTILVDCGTNQNVATILLQK